MRSVNKVILIGNLTRDPELKETQGGQSVTTFGIATNREWMTSEGERKESAEFHEVAAWARLAEICAQYLHKGSKIYIEGRLQTRSWDDQTGNKRYMTEIVADNMIMLDSKGGGGGYNKPSDPAAPREEDAPPIIDVEMPTTSGADEVKVEEVPF